MSFDEFYSKCFLPHTKEDAHKTPLAHDGYKIQYKNGDVYRYEEKLISGRAPDFNGYHGMDDFDCKSTFNGIEIH
jgi:hypothetical protein